jgi:integrase
VTSRLPLGTISDSAAKGATELPAAVAEPDNVRARLLAAVRERADELLERRGERLIAHLTPHRLRHTFASLLAEVGVSPRRAMYLLGHSDPKFTMRVY